MKPLRSLNGRGIRPILVALAPALVGVLIAWLAAAGQAGAVVRPDPLALALRPAAEGTALLLIENVQNLYGLEAHVTFDPNIVEVVDADPNKPGVQSRVAGWLKDGFVAANDADNAAGRLTFAATLINPAPPFSGSRDFLTITFKARGNGVSPLALESAVLVTRDAEVITSQVQKGSIGVSADGTFPAAALALPASAAAPAAAVTIAPTPGSPNLLSLIAFLSMVAFMASAVVFVYALTR